METAGRAKKVYQCTVDTCGKVFSRSSHRSRHYKSTHIQPFAFKCPVLACGKRFSRSDILKKHVKVHTTGSSNTSDIFTAALVNEARAAAAENGPGIVTTDTALAARLELGHHHPSGHQQPSYISTTINSQPSIGMPMEIGEQQGYRSQGWTPSSSLQYQYPTPVPTPLTSPSLAHVNVNFNVSLSSSSYTSYPTTTSTVPTSFAPTSTVSTAWATPHYAQYSPPATLPQLSTFPHQSNSLSNSITLPAYRSSGQIVNHDRSVVLVQPPPQPRPFNTTLTAFHLTSILLKPFRSSHLSLLTELCTLHPLIMEGGRKSFIIILMMRRTGAVEVY
ncbi:hypothetical protein BC829DRAFT_136678 [Chytridium lagenaria]|nr:hypothetical protein BC829DRAFT_136678 [Chytridium lagenaria]